jgi:TolB protein
LRALITPQALTSVAENSPTPSLAVLDSPAPTIQHESGSSPFTGWIAYGYGEDNNREIFLMHPTSGSRRQITSNTTLEEAPSFSPDNWSLVYASYRTQGGWELYSYDLQKGIERQLTAFEGEAHFPVWSPVPGDTRILFERRVSQPERATNIWMLDTATGNVQQITHGSADARPGWSADGKMVLFARSADDTNGDGLITTGDASDIYSMDLDSGEEKNLTNTPEYSEFNSAWSPDGRWIAYTSVRRDANGDGSINLDDSQDLFAMRVDGSEERFLDMGGRATFSPSWSPDGVYLAVLVMEKDGINAIWRYNFQTGSFARITDPGPYFHPRYSNSP